MNKDTQTIQDCLTPEQTESTDLPLVESVQAEINEEQVDTDEQELTLESVVEWLEETEEGKRLIQPMLDRFFTKGLDTWKANHLQAILDENERKRNDPKEQQLLQLEKEIAKEEHLDKVMTKLKEVKMLPVGLADAFVNVDSKRAIETIDRLVSELQKTIPALVKQETEIRFNILKG